MSELSEKCVDRREAVLIVRGLMEKEGAIQKSLRVVCKVRLK